jgi:tetratricopeptide (TPR) repeat protein
LLISKENYESAVEHLLKAKERYPEEYSFPHILSDIYYNHKEYDRARSEMAEALRLAPPEKREELQILYRKIEGGILNTQIKELRESIEQDPTNVDLRFQLIEKLMANSYLEGVTSEIDTLLYYHPEMKKEIMAFIEDLTLRYERNYLLLDFLADMSLKEGNFDKCMDIYERMSVRSLDQREAMRSCVEKILKIDASYLPAHRKIGDLAHEAKDLETLIAHYRICFEGDKEMMADRLEPFFDALYETGALEEAERVGLSMTARFPENARLFTKLGRVYLDRGRFVEAISAFEKAKALATDDKETLTLLEETLRREKKRQIDEVLKKLEKEPDNSEYREQAGDLFSFFEDYTEAVKHYQRATQLAPHPDLCKAKLAFSLARRGMMDLAEETLDEVKLSLTENPDQEGLKSYFYMTAVHFEKELQTQTALKFFKQIFRVDAGYRDVVDRIEKIENLGVTVTPYGKRIRKK